jgi:alkylation response protein AidB-like acyl-CoA dehydrogenase
VQHPLARAYVELEAARLMVREASGRFDKGENAGIVANAAKLLASEAAYAAYDATVQAHGGYAFDAEYDLVGLYQIIRLLRIAPINNEAVLNYVAQRALKLPRSY